MNENYMRGKDWKFMLMGNRWEKNGYLEVEILKNKIKIFDGRGI